jgi:hypothetical protein
MANHMDYMHPSFPASKDNEHTPHLKHMHDVSHEDGMLRDRAEAHSADGSGAGTIVSGHGNR